MYGGFLEFVRASSAGQNSNIQAAVEKWGCQQVKTATKCFSGQRVCLCERSQAQTKTSHVLVKRKEGQLRPRQRVGEPHG